MNNHFIEQKEVSHLPFKADSFNDIFEQIKIQTNNVCTRKCKYCYYGNKKNDKFSDDELSEEVVYKIIDDLAKINFSGRVSFYEINEPLTDHRLFDFIAYAKKRLPNAWHTLTSNGDLLNDENLRLLFHSGLDKLFVSVYDESSKKRLIVMRQNNVSLFDKIELMDLMGSIFFDSVDNRGGNLENCDFVAKADSPLSFPCEKVYKIMYVRPSGNVVSCFADFYEKNILGNVYYQGIKDIWFGDKFKDLRRSLDAGNRKFSSLCSKCDYKGSGGYFSK